MRSLSFYCLFLLVPLSPLFAQDQQPTDGRIGIYRSKDDPSLELRIDNRNGQLIVGILGQGTVPLKETSPGHYKLAIVKPVVTLDFEKDIAGNVIACRIFQKEPPHSWTRIGEASPDPVGDYHLDINPYPIFHIHRKEGGLFVQTGITPEIPLTNLGPNIYQYTYEEKKYGVKFQPDAGGAIKNIVISGSYPLRLTRVSAHLPHVSNRTNGFTHADTLQGTLTPVRSCYDVLFYDLALTILPETKSIRGSNTIRWRTVQPFRRMQVDLFENLTIDTILYHGATLSYTRDGNAVYIDLPVELATGSVDELRIVYSGTPLQPDAEATKGGIFWLWDKNRHIWIESVTQGIGASVYWPCKDHLSDRPDSMRICVTVPRDLTEISNGRLVSKTELPGDQTHYEWYVDYPIVTYNVAIYVGDYAHFSDVYVRPNGDSLPLNFYCMRYNLDTARAVFADATRMLALYERDFGPYPFPRDGYTALEGIYPMDHQGAVCIGPMRSPFNSDTYDHDLRRSMWHESAHEWWGNNVGCSDYADMWIHEGFATYAEFLNSESSRGRAAAVKETLFGSPDNKAPIIGVYNVNHFHMGDMYLKGALLLETLRNLTANDSLWFSIFHAIQERFRYTPVRTEAVEGVFSELTGKDFRGLFDQYLRHAAIPVLQLGFQHNADRLHVTYKWVADVPGFHMPIKVSVAKGRMEFIYPTTDPQSIDLEGMTEKDFTVDTDHFYVKVKRE